MHTATQNIQWCLPKLSMMRVTSLIKLVLYRERAASRRNGGTKNVISRIRNTCPIHCRNVVSIQRSETVKMEVEIDGTFSYREVHIIYT